MKWRKRGFSAISFCNLYLVVAAVRVQCQKKPYVSQRVDALVHKGNWIRITHIFCVAFSVVHTESEWAIIFRAADNCRYPLSFRQFNDFPLKALGDLYLPELMHFGSSSTWHGVDWSPILCWYISPMLGYLASAQVAILHRIEFW